MYESRIESKFFKSHKNLFKNTFLCLRLKKNFYYDFDFLLIELALNGAALLALNGAALAAQKNSEIKYLRRTNSSN
ncbi:hypothetical protein BpHYR1_019512 [Brachionus plicatilis]|uniref:Uncharacterized protein n=1 Tax=Brachionus plicatilis TaxID=10195 RepID=A0A3M7PXW8_BRAPC|nr:hypothetical protein BpHYR1_019512 [Brachionus plicatilis]